MGLTLDLKKSLVMERDNLLKRVEAINTLVGSYGAAERLKLPVTHPVKAARGKKRGRSKKVAATPPAAAPQTAPQTNVHEMSAERKQAFADRMAKARAAKTSSVKASSATPETTQEEPLNKEKEMEVGAPGAATGAVR